MQTWSTAHVLFGWAGSSASLRATPARICDPSWSLHCQTATAAWNAACNTRAAFHLAFHVRARSHSRVLGCRLWICSGADFARAGGLDPSGACFGCTSGVVAHTIQYPYHMDATAHLALAFFVGIRCLDRDNCNSAIDSAGCRQPRM